MGDKIVRPEIATLLKEVVRIISIEDVFSIVTQRQHSLEQGFALFAKYDKRIPGKGIHNIERPDGEGGWTGNYDIVDRPIYRPIQYVEAYFTWENFEWLTRDIVEMACLHIESCLKRYCRDRSRRMFGKLLSGKEGRTLPTKLWNWLDQVRQYLYNPAKHYIPECEDHLFSKEEAIASYFICRKLGLELLQLIQQREQRPNVGTQS